MADVIDLETRRAARAGVAVPEQPADPRQRPGWLCRIDVFEAVEPDTAARAYFHALNQERIAKGADLEVLADALEQIAASLRLGVRDAV